MIHEFLSSWDLFANAWLSAWLIALILGGLGVMVLARNQVFLGAAMAQASTCGVAVALLIAGLSGAEWLEGGELSGIMAVLMAIVTALVVGLGGKQREPVTAWIFLVGSAGAVLAVANSPHGMEEVNHLVASSLIGAMTRDVIELVSLALVSAALVLGLGQRLAVVVLDAEFAAATGMRVQRWELLQAVWLGTAIGLALHVAGLLYVFGCLLLPALVARELCRELRRMVWAAPVIGLGGSMAGTILANGWDLPPAQVTVLLLALLVPVAATVKRLRR